MQLTQTKWLWTLLFAFWSYQLQATIIYVDYQATGSNNGTSWTNAYTDFNSALLSATFGDEIRVAEGNYQAPPDGFVLKDGVRINGGYPSATRYPANLIWLVESLRSYTTYPTYLEATPSLNSTSETTLRQISNLSNQTRLDGLYIVGNEALIVDTNYSGILLNTSLVVSNCIFRGDNISSSSPLGFAVIFPRAGDYIIQPTFRNCTFENFSYFIIGNTSAQDNWSPKFNKCKFSDIQTYVFGVNLFGGTFSPEINDCEFTGNRTVFRSFNNIGSILKINVVNSLFIDNDRVVEIYQERGALGNIFTNCTFYENGSAVNIPFVFWWNSAQYNDNNPVTVASFRNCISWRNLNNAGKLIELSPGLHVNVQNSLLEASSFNSSASSDPVFSIPSPHPTIDRVRDLGGNILNQNPQFVNPTAATSDLRLQASSPARNAGNNNLIPAGVTRDITINDRILEGAVDMGAYEFCESGDGACNPIVVDPGDPTFEMVSTENEMTVFPNPVQEVIHLQVSKEVKIHAVTLTNLQGEVLKTWQTATHLEVAALEKGLYLLKVETNKGVMTIRVIKE